MREAGVVLLLLATQNCRVVAQAVAYIAALSGHQLAAAAAAVAAGELCMHLSAEAALCASTACCNRPEQQAKPVLCKHTITAISALHQHVLPSTSLKSMPTLTSNSCGQHTC
jgi:hypothetical protein